MIRVVFVALCIVAAWVAVVSLVRFARERKVDWTGIAFALGFVTLAFWLRGMTGMG